MSETTNVRLVLQHLSPVKARDVLAALPPEAVARHNGDLWHTLWDELVTEILAPLNITFLELWRVPARSSSPSGTPTASPRSRRW